MMKSLHSRPDLTFKHNMNSPRHGWLRLTPAYSVKLVSEFLANASDSDWVLDPFCGTGTTGVVSAQTGIKCDMFDINPFLVWLATAKTRNYTDRHRDGAELLARDCEAILNNGVEDGCLWIPPIHRVDRWWNPPRLRTLASLFEGIRSNRPDAPNESVDIVKIVFCQLLIEWSNASFGHQSMSFKKPSSQSFILDDADAMLRSFKDGVNKVSQDTRDTLSGDTRVSLGDSRNLTRGNRRYTIVLTSPPYPNRMSYIRELRPYMYWLGYLREASDASDMDWDAIGGTWGSATSRLLEWVPKGHLKSVPAFADTIAGISRESQLLANYVHRYFEDMYEHFRTVATTLKKGGRVCYIIGNSKFYDTIVHTECIFQELLGMHGFSDIQSCQIRKRSSKKELYEYAVSATYEG